MATPLQMSITTAAATGAAYALSRPCTLVRLTNTDAANGAYVSVRNVNNGDVVTAPGSNPAPTAGTSSNFLFLAAGQSIEIDALRNIISTSDIATGYTGEKITHLLVYSASANVVINLMGTN